MSKQLPEQIAEMQPAAAHIYRELQWSDGDCLTISDLKTRTGRDQSTIRRATTALENANFVTHEWADDDPRCRLICLRR